MDRGWGRWGFPLTSPSYRHVFWHHMRRSRRQTDTERRQRQRQRLRRRKVTRPAGKEDDKSPSPPTQAFLKHEPPRRRPMRTGLDVSTSSPKILPPSKDTGGAGEGRRRERRSAEALRLRQRESFKRFYPSNFREAGMESGRTRDRVEERDEGGGGGWITRGERKGRGRGV